jgi:eukaryotic-like serine/threonine-protein kinase
MTFNDETSPVQPGDVLAQKYRVDAVLGVGGMGVVVAATHLQLDERFALKFMLPWALADQGAVERFAREARAAVRLKSAHAARVVDVGTLETGSPFMVMEFLEGHDLAAVVEGHRQLPVPEAADYILQACDAVAEAHSLGIVHRDLKPKNLFRVTGHDGNPLIKVLDFGISKIRGTSDLSLTKTSEVIGSPSYMSPEQLRASRDVDERTDIWALGVILYELLGGVVPFDAQTVTQLTAMVLLDSARPIQEIRPDIPPAIADLLARCLEKDPAMRVPSVADVADVLDAYAPEHSRGLARRIRQVCETKAGRSVPPPSSSLAGVGSGPVSRVPVTGGTSVSWSKTELAGPPAGTPRPGVVPSTPPPAGRPTRWGLIALFMLLGTASGVGLVLLYGRSATSGPEVAAPTESTSAAPVVATPPASASTTAAEGVPTAGGATTAAASHPPAVSPAAPPTTGPVAATPTPDPAVKPNRPRGSPRAGREAGAAPASDDIPMDRH